MSSKLRIIILCLICVPFFVGAYIGTINNTNQGQSDEPAKLAIVWTSGDKEVAKEMVFMYANASKRYEWWKDITFLVWGPSQKLLLTDIELQEQMKKMQELGVKVEVCKACANDYGIAGDLEECGFSVEYIGQPLTRYIKDPEWTVVTF